MDDRVGVRRINGGAVCPPDRLSGSSCREGTMDILSRQQLGEPVATAAAHVWQKAQAGPANRNRLRGDWLSHWLSTARRERDGEAKGVGIVGEIGAGDPD